MFKIMSLVMIPHRSFYLIRHGETDWNTHRLITGQQDISLNPMGCQQAESVAKILINKNIKQIFSSPLLRTRQTADIINKHLNLPIFYNKDLIERGWGEGEGKPHPDKFSLSMFEDKTLPKGAESHLNFQQRITTALASILQQCDGTPLIVGHGGIFVALLHFFKQVPLHICNCRPYLFMPPEDIMQKWTFKEITFQ